MHLPVNRTGKSVTAETFYEKVIQVLFIEGIIPYEFFILMPVLKILFIINMVLFSIALNSSTYILLPLCSREFIIKYLSV
jgi:hypothetical protein